MKPEKINKQDEDNKQVALFISCIFELLHDRKSIIEKDAKAFKNSKKYPLCTLCHSLKYKKLIDYCDGKNDNNSFSHNGARIKFSEFEKAFNEYNELAGVALNNREKIIFFPIDDIKKLTYQGESILLDSSKEKICYWLFNKLPRGNEGSTIKVDRTIWEDDHIQYRTMLKDYFNVFIQHARKLEYEEEQKENEKKRNKKVEKQRENDNIYLPIEHDESQFQYSNIHDQKNLYLSVPPLPKKYLHRDNDVKEIKEVLFSDELNYISIQGMGGLGKSTLATIVANDNEVQKEFSDGIYFIKLGKNPNIKEIQSELLSYLYHSTSQISSSELKKVLAFKKVILIIDDVWDVSHLSNFYILNIKSKLIITTRHKGIFTDVDSKEFNVNLLTKPDALKLLEIKVGGVQENLLKIADEILKETGLLPLAINIIGAMLKGPKNILWWQDVLKKLENADLKNIQLKKITNEYHKSLYTVIQVSVEYLNNDLQNRYHELSIFNDEEKISFHTLYVYWGDQCFNIIEEFVSSTLLFKIEENEEDYYYLHDLQKDFIRCDNINDKQNKILVNYKEKYSNKWANIPISDDYFYSQYLNITENTILSIEISEDILYKQRDLSTKLILEINVLLKLDLEKTIKKLFYTNNNRSELFFIFFLGNRTGTSLSKFMIDYLEEKFTFVFKPEVVVKILDLLFCNDAYKNKVLQFSEKYVDNQINNVSNNLVFNRCLEVLAKEKNHIIPLNLIEESILNIETYMINRNTLVIYIDIIKSVKNEKYIKNICEFINNKIENKNIKTYIQIIPELIYIISELGCLKLQKIMPKLAKVYIENININTEFSLNYPELLLILNKNIKYKKGMFIFLKNIMNSINKNKAYDYHPHMIDTILNLLRGEDTYNASVLKFAKGITDNLTSYVCETDIVFLLFILNNSKQEQYKKIILKFSRYIIASGDVDFIKSNLYQDYFSLINSFYQVEVNTTKTPYLNTCISIVSDQYNDEVLESIKNFFLHTKLYLFDSYTLFICLAFITNTHEDNDNKIALNFAKSFLIKRNQSLNEPYIINKLIEIFNDAKEIEFKDIAMKIKKDMENEGLDTTIPKSRLI
jgi:hypothetical protein